MNSITHLPEITPSVFDALGIADRERIHSQIIYWLFNGNSLLGVDDQFFFDNICKSTLLNQMTGQVNILYSKFKCHTEYHSVDIVIETEQVNGKKEVFAIENKLKTGEHDNQLKRYPEIIRSAYPDYKPHFIFLTLREEKLEKIENKEWVNYTYKMLLFSLNQIIIQSESSDYVVFKEYIKSLTNLIKTTDDFLANFIKYPNVFTDGSKRKAEKYLNTSFNSVANYISKTGLETFLQSVFLETIKDKLKVDDSFTFNLGETRGEAILDIVYNKGVKLKINDHTRQFCDFQFGLQFQGSIIKIFLSPRGSEKVSHKGKEKEVSIYGLSKRTWLNEQQLKRIFMELINNEEIAREIKILKFSYPKSYAFYNIHCDFLLKSESLDGKHPFIALESENKILERFRTIMTVFQTHIIPDIQKGLKSMGILE